MALLHTVRVGTLDESTEPRTVLGAGPVVLLGSLGSSVSMWDPQLQGLEDLSTVIACDLRGHGDSPVVSDPVSVSNLAADVIETMDATGVDQFHVVGLSLGGAIAQTLAIEYPERIATVTLIATAPTFGDPQQWIDRAASVRENGTASLIDATLPRWMTSTFLEANPDIKEKFAQMIAYTDDEGYALCCEAIANFNSTDRLGEIDQPVLTVAGTEDPTTPPEVLVSIADKVQNARSEVVSPAGHVPTYEQGAEVTALIRAHTAAR